MFVIRTGFQGHSKTLNSIKEIDEKAHAEGRTVYYCNITAFKPDHPAIKATWVEFDHPETWFDLPANAIIVIDEAQTWFRVRSQGSKVPAYASRLEIMRKDGHELHCITQSPKFIDAHMRDLCSRHIHYHRPNDGPWVKRWEFQKVQIDANQRLSFTDGESTRIGIDSAYFGCYKSVKEGTEHHFKFRVPRAALVLGFVALVIGGLGFYLYDRLTGFEEASLQPLDAPESVPVESTSVPVSDAPRTSPEQYISDRTPRIPGVPSSAPIYDDLTKPVTFPKPSCYATSDTYILHRKARTLKLGDRHGRPHGCACLSQQGSRMDIPFDACMDMVENGSFDATKPDFQQRADGGPDALRASGTPSAAPSDSAPVASQNPSTSSIAVYGITNADGNIQ